MDAAPLAAPLAYCRPFMTSTTTTRPSVRALLPVLTQCMLNHTVSQYHTLGRSQEHGRCLQLDTSRRDRQRPAGAVPPQRKLRRYEEQGLQPRGENSRQAHHVKDGRSADADFSPGEGLRTCRSFCC
eukprot:6185312-Pleurochrysis_carterae.AAC.3